MHLVDVLVAAALLATVFASLPSAFASAVRASLAAADTTWTVVLAAQKIEELRSQPFPDAGVYEAFDLLDAGGRAADGPRSAPAYRRTWRTEPRPFAPDQTVIITVVVSPYRLSAASGIDAAVPGTTRLVTLRTRRAAQ
jgi:hypothetical protein